MLIIGGSQEKIKIINIVQKQIDFTNVSILELETKLPSSEIKNSIINMIKNLQCYSFLIDYKLESDTFLLRNLLKIKSVYPIINFSRKNIQGSVYTRVPIIKEAFNEKMEMISIPEEDPIYAIGIAIKLNESINNTETVVRQYYFNKNLHKNKFVYIMFGDNNTSVILKNLYNQMRLAFELESMIDNITVIELDSYKFIRKHVKIVIESWYSEKEKEAIMYLLRDKWEWTYNLYPLMKLGNNIDLLYYFNIEGINSEKITSYFEQLDTTLNKEKELLKIEKNIIERSNIAKRYLIIIEKKLGSNVYNKILLTLNKGKHFRLPGGSMAIPYLLVNIDNPEQVLELLSKEEQTIVKNQYNIQERYFKALKNNKCGHIRIYRKMINSKNFKSTEKFFEELEKYYSPPINGFIICKECKFELMCEHMYEYKKLYISKASISKLSNVLSKYSIKIRINKNNEFYCKTCGERIIQDINLDEFNIRVKSGLISENEIEIQDYLWSVIMTALNAISFGDIFINEKKFAIIISNTLKSIIMEEVLSLNDKNKIIIIMYVFAYILNIIKIHKLSFMKIPYTSQISVITEKILIYIYTKYINVINAANYKTNDIKNKFFESYKKIIEKNINEIPIMNVESNLSYYMLNIDSTYHYANIICKILKLTKKENSPANVKHNFELIMGRSLPDIIKKAKQNSKNIKYISLFDKKYSGKISADLDLDYLFLSDDFNLYSKLFNIKNADNILNKFLNGDKSLYFYSSYIMHHKYISEIKNKKQFDNYLELLSKFRIIENEILQDNKINFIKSFYSINYKKNSHFKEKKVLITELYDENGLKHKWNNFTYDNNYNIIETKCSICGLRRSEINTLNIEKTYRSIDAIHNLMSFYTFYKIKCPVNELHNWKNDICSKCNLTENLLYLVNIGKINKEVHKYYNTYESKFEEEKSSVTSNLETMIEFETLKEYEKIDFSYDYSYVVKVSELTKVSTNAIEAIGLTEGRKYSEVLEGINKPEIDFNYLYATYTELLYLVTEYSLKGHIIKIDPFESMIHYYPLAIVQKFLIQNICKSVLETNIIEPFIKIIETQKLLSITESYDWNINDEDDDSGIYLGDDIGDHGEDLAYENSKKNDPYSGNDIDYEGINDEEDSNVMADKD
jgi:hypothetical protein